MTEQVKIVALLTAMAEYYGRNMSAAALEMMADDLSDLTFAEVQAAARAHRRGPRAAFFPMPGELLALLEGDSATATTLALADLQGAIRDCGAYRQPRFEDPLIQRTVIALGGWVEVCHMEPEMLIPHFRKCYEPMHRSGAGPGMADEGGYLPAGRTQTAPVQIGAALGDLIAYGHENEQNRLD